MPMTLEADREREILRELARAYMAVACSPEQERRRAAWRDLNGLRRRSRPIYARWFDSWGEAPESVRACHDPLFGEVELFLRQMLAQATIGDDYVIEPWVVMRASFVLPAGGHWGMSPRWERPPGEAEGLGLRGAGRWDAPMREPDDIERLAVPIHRIDEAQTSERLTRLHEAIGDIVPVAVSRAPFYQSWTGDLSTDLAYLRGLEQVMWDMVDRPGWLHDLLGRMQRGVMRAHDAAEAAGDWHLCDHHNQAMPYAHGLPDPAPAGPPVLRSQLWCFMAAQELTLVSPEMHWEFMLAYQLPILERFGLVAYGCCEDLTRKIHLLRRIPNLRRIAVTPRADVGRCAEAIGTDYVISWRPNPADMVCCGFDEAHVRRVVRESASALGDAYFDVTLKDVTTTQGDTGRVKRWVNVVRDELARAQ